MTLEQLKRRREYQRRGGVKKYGLTLERYQQMVIDQNNVCAACNRPEPSKKALAVDHDHVTGRVRKLLCTNCNVVLGQVNDNMEHLLKIKAYLEEQMKCQN